MPNGPIQYGVAGLLPDRSSDRNRDGKAVRRRYQVLSDGTLTELTVLTATGLPALGSAHPDDATLVVSRVSPQCDDNRKRWVVEVEYSDDEAKQPHPLGKPWQKTPEVKWGQWAQVQPLLYLSGAVWLPATNSAGDAFDPPPQVERHFPSVLILRNERAFDPARAYQYVDTVNAVAVRVAGLTIAARCALLTEYAGENDEENDVPYARVTYRILLTPYTWDARILDRGYRYLDGGVRKRALVAQVVSGVTTYKPTPEPVLLDGAGAQLAVGATPVTRTFAQYRATNWADLGLPKEMP